MSLHTSFSAAVMAWALLAATSGTAPCQAPSATGPAQRGLAPRPPMGWNSWDSYGLRVDEAQFRENTSVMVERLKSSGYSTAVIDEGWFLRNPEDRPHPERLQFELDANGRYLPVPARFPSAVTGDTNTGFRDLAAWVHSRGLTFGIHIVRGIPRESVARNLPIEGSASKLTDAADQTDACPWDPTNWGVKDNAAGQAWYDALIRQYATWGVDFLKVDCISDHPYKVSEIRQIHRAIQHSGRHILLSLSPGPTAPAHAAEVASLAQMWRISDDVWDVWASTGKFPRSVKGQFAAAAQWAPYARPGNWPDADMLPVGQLSPHPDIGPGPRYTRLTLPEQQTQLSLWSFARSPLIVGANLTLLDAETERLLTSRDILAIDQTARASREILHEGDLIIWTADLPGNRHAVGFFNTGDTPLTANKSLAELKLPNRKYNVRNAWEGKDLDVKAPTSIEVAPHGVVVLMLTP